MDYFGWFYRSRPYGLLVAAGRTMNHEAMGIAEVMIAPGLSSFYEDPFGI
jgi:hypothetical protein